MPFYPYLTPLNSRFSSSALGCFPPSFFDTVTKNTFRGAGASSCLPALFFGSPYTFLQTCLHPFSVSLSLPLSRPSSAFYRFPCPPFPARLFFRPPSSAFYPRPSSVTFPASVVLVSRPQHPAFISLLLPPFSPSISLPLSPALIFFSCISYF